MPFLRLDTKNGFTLLEVLISMAAGSVLLSTVVTILVLQYKTVDVQEQIIEMVQTARAALDMMGREIRMAGLDTAGAGFNGISYNPSKIQIATDFRGEKPKDPSDGDINDPNERIVYCFDPSHSQIDRNTGGGDQPFAENVQSFSFEYLDAQGKTTTSNVDIRQVRVRITVRTARPDPEYAPNDGYRTYTLTSLITPVNLACR
jgi:type IV pilus assembly protein PilW